MAKPERGLPAGFDIKLSNTPVQLGDYLDSPPRIILPPAPPPVPLPEPVAAAPPPVARPRGVPPRKQVNMSPDTLRMVDELLAHVRTHSAERDIRASELVHALVMAVHEVRPFLDLTPVGPRGKWGSPTAAALPVALKDAFQSAITRYRARS